MICVIASKWSNYGSCSMRDATAAVTSASSPASTAPRRWMNRSVARASSCRTSSADFGSPLFSEESTICVGVDLFGCRFLRHLNLSKNWGRQRCERDGETLALTLTLSPEERAQPWATTSFRMRIRQRRLTVFLQSGERSPLSSGERVRVRAGVSTHYLHLSSTLIGSTPSASELITKTIRVFRISEPRLGCRFTSHTSPRRGFIGLRARQIRCVPIAPFRVLDIVSAGGESLRFENSTAARDRQLQELMAAGCRDFRHRLGPSLRTRSPQCHWGCQAVHNPWRLCSSHREQASRL